MPKGVRRRPMKKSFIIAIVIVCLAVFGFWNSSGKTAHHVTVAVSGNVVEPYKCWVSQMTQAGVFGGMVSAQFANTSRGLSGFVDEVPEIDWNKAVEVRIPQDVDLKYIEIFDDTCRIIEKIYELNGLYQYMKDADTGTYYVAVAVDWEGKYILTEFQREYFCCEYVFEIRKED